MPFPATRCGSSFCMFRLWATGSKSLECSFQAAIATLADYMMTTTLSPTSLLRGLRRVQSAKGYASNVVLVFLKNSTSLPSHCMIRTTRYQTSGAHSVAFAAIFLGFGSTSPAKGFKLPGTGDDAWRKEIWYKCCGDCPHCRVNKRSFVYKYGFIIMKNCLSGCLTVACGI